MPDIVIQVLFFGFLISMALLEIARRKRKAKEFAMTWLRENDFSLPDRSNVEANAFFWPVRVTILAQDKRGEHLSIVLRVGGPLGGIFAETITCESKKVCEVAHDG